LVLAAVALCILGAVVFKLVPRGGPKPETAKGRATVSTGARASSFLEANEYFEKAMLFLRTQFNLPSAKKMLERALEIDPHFAEARGWYGFTFILEIDSGSANDSSSLYRAEQELRRALEDDPDSARSHASLAALYFYQGRKDLIPEEVEKALVLNPVETDAKIWGANYYAMNGEFSRAKELVSQILAVDPLFFPARMILGDILRTEGDIDGAIREQGKILEQDPHNHYASQKLARAHIDGNDLAAARRYLENISPEDQRGYEVRLSWAQLLALEGKTREAREKMDGETLAYAALAPWSTSLAAEFYAVTGEPEESLDWLEKAVRNGDERADWFRRDPLLAKVRDLPRFREIIDSIEFRRQTIR
jgi:Tfp pilus assembly protein PilF